MRRYAYAALLLIPGALCSLSYDAVAATKISESAPDAAASGYEQLSSPQPWIEQMSTRVLDLIPDANRRSQTLRLIYDTAIQYDVDPVVVLALITVESKFQPRAVSKTGALGMMQVMPFWMKEIGHPSDDLFDVPTNLAYGCAILKRYLMLSNGNLGKALASYNGGGDPQYTEKVMHQLNTRFTR